MVHRLAQPHSNARFVLSSLLVAALWLTGSSQPLSAEPAPYQWTPEDRTQMLEALRLLQRSSYSEALRLALPLYRKAPHHKEEFRDRDYQPVKGNYLLPETLTTEWTAAGILSCTLEGDRQYSKSIAITAGTCFRMLGAPIPHDAPPIAHSAFIVRRDRLDCPLAVTVNDLWIDFQPDPVLREQCLFVALMQLAPHLSYQATSSNGQAKVELRRKQPPGLLVFEQGKKEVRSQGAESFTLEQAPFRHEGVLMAPAAEVAKLLKGEVHWYPEVRFMHLIIPDVPSQSSPK